MEPSDYARLCMALGLCDYAEGQGYVFPSVDSAVGMAEALLIKGAECDGLLRPLPRRLKDWDKSDGAVLWWRFPIVEPPYAGTPLDDEFPDYVTHWTPIVLPWTPCEEE